MKKRSKRTRRRSPRCIALVDRIRCRHNAARGMGDLFCCTRHGRITLAIIDDWLSPQTRQMLAYAKWQTVREGQRLIERMYGRRAA